MPVGFTIRVTTPGSGGASTQEFFQVAIDDENRAKDAVRIAAKLANSTPVEVVGKLSPTEIGWLALAARRRQVVRRTIAGSERQGIGKRR